jgi:hypothetical protein
MPNFFHSILSTMPLSFPFFSQVIENAGMQPNRRQEKENSLVMLLLGTHYFFFSIVLVLPLGRNHNSRSSRKRAQLIW